MPTIEVDELEVQQNRTLRTQIETYLKNPQAKRKLLEAQKIVAPDTKIPELDTPDPIEEIRKASDAGIAELRKQMADDKAARERDTTLSALKSKQDAGFAELRRQKYTADGIKAVEQIMEDKGILDPIDAAAIFEKNHPPQTPIVSSGSGAWNFMDLPSDDDDDLKKLVASRGDNDALTSKMARDALTDFRGFALR